MSRTSPKALEAMRAATPARILTGRAGASYRTATLLGLRADHAAARDAVRAGLDLDADLGEEFVAQWGLFEVQSRAASKEEFLLRPDLGRALNEDAKVAIRSRCLQGADVQIVIGDGLSTAAVRKQVPLLLPLLDAELRRRGWIVGRPFVVRHCRVGVLNEIGLLLEPSVVLLLIGERPGLATAESLSSYLAYKPRPGDDDSHRNLISNIHDRGVPPGPASHRIADLVAAILRSESSGFALKEAASASSPIVGPADSASGS